MATHLAKICRSTIFGNISSLSRVCLRRCLRTSSCVGGLEEFFPPGVLEKGEYAPDKVTTGRRWRAGELRIKSNDDLHKLWYVLLKERNMLDTLMHEAKRQGVPMPSPERYHKVKKSMASIKLVLGERERAIQDLADQEWPFDVEKVSEAEQNLSPEEIVLNENNPSIEEAALARMNKIDKSVVQNDTTKKVDTDHLESPVLKPT